MNRKDFLRGMAAVAGSLVVPRTAGAVDFHTALQAASASGEDAFWKVVRDQFVLEPGWTYLNFGGLGSCPLPVLNSFWEWTTKSGAQRRPRRKTLVGGQGKAGAPAGKTCRKEDLALIDSATEGIDMIINGLPLEEGRRGHHLDPRARRGQSRPPEPHAARRHRRSACSSPISSARRVTSTASPPDHPRRA